MSELATIRAALVELIGDDWARAVHKRSMARVLALMIAVEPTVSTETA